MGKKDKIEVEVEYGDREVEIEIDPEAGTMEVREEREDSAEEDSAEEATEPRDSGSGGSEPEEEPEPSGDGGSGPRFLFGLLLGSLAGVAAASLFGRQPPEAPPTAEEPSRGVLGTLRSRWKVARQEARQAAREAEEKKRARFAELTEIER